MRSWQAKVAPAIGPILHAVRRLKLATWLMGRLHALTFLILTILALLALVSYLKILKSMLKWISDVCCGGSDDTGGDASTVNSTTEAIDVTTASDDLDSSAIKIGSSLLALFLAKLL